MLVRDLLKQLQDLPPDTPVCVAEIDEAFATEVALVEIVESAGIVEPDADEDDDGDDEIETIDLEGGGQTVVVLRW